ncbi:MAG: alpha/beta fold hydrolase [Rhodospirillales bacterium]|nr:alpha/beta fold hydrolase [Acetobacter sp.]
MGIYLLIHGSWHGAWCWDKIIPLLERDGHDVITLDLPGHGGDTTPTSEVTLQSYADSICRVLDAQSQPVILVGHSMGGIAISQAAEYRPEKIKALIFLSAFLLRDGESLSDVALFDKDSLIPPNIITDESQGIATFREDAITNTFYGNCSEADRTWAKSRLCPEPLAPLTTPLKISEANFGKVPRLYIECLKDAAVSLKSQRQMHMATPCYKVLTMNTDHSPFFCAPKELTKNLLAV